MEDNKSGHTADQKTARENGNISEHADGHISEHTDGHISEYTVGNISEPTDAKKPVKSYKPVAVVKPMTSGNLIYCGGQYSGDLNTTLNRMAARRVEFVDFDKILNFGNIIVRFVFKWFIGSFHFYIGKIIRKDQQ